MENPARSGEARSRAARAEELRVFLDRKAAEYNRPSFIADDPISIPHRYTQKQDIEIAGFFAAIFSWGNRKTIIQKSQQLMQLMDDAPYQFVRQHTDSDLKRLLGFRHRTFNPTDLLYFIVFFRRHYALYGSLEDAFLLPWEERGGARGTTAAAGATAAAETTRNLGATAAVGPTGAAETTRDSRATAPAGAAAVAGTTADPGTKRTTSMAANAGTIAAPAGGAAGKAARETAADVATGYDARSALSAFHHYFFSVEEDGERIAPPRTRKHISTPEKSSSCKRINMFLRWMVRKDGNGVDFGIWQRIPMNLLICPLDLHVARVAKRFGLLTRERSDWQAAVQLTEGLSLLDKDDPVKYDFALFGLGVMENF